jgi:hypothetical protein
MHSVDKLLSRICLQEQQRQSAGAFMDTLQQHGNEAAMFLLSSEAEQQHNPCKGASAVYGYMG